MNKRNNLLFLLRTLPVVTIFLFWLVTSNRLLYAQTISSTITPTSSPTPNQLQKQTLSTNEYLTLIIATFSAIGTLFSGCAAVVALRKSNSNVTKIDFVESTLEKMTPAMQDIFSQMINRAKNDHEKQKILQQKTLFEEQVTKLKTRKLACIKARKWLIKTREYLADQAVAHTLANEPVAQNIRDDFRKDINRYLYGIQECLEIGRPNILDDLDIKRVLPSSFYKEALKFVLDNKAKESLSDDVFAEIEFYFQHIISHL